MAQFTDPNGPPQNAFATADTWVRTGQRQRWASGAWSPVGYVGAPAVALTPGSNVVVDSTLGDVFTLTPGETETITVSPQIAGQRIVIVILTSGTQTYTLTFGTGFTSTGTLATGSSDAKVFTIEFVSDGTAYRQIARSTAM